MKLSDASNNKSGVGTSVSGAEFGEDVIPGKEVGYICIPEEMGSITLIISEYREKIIRGQTLQPSPISATRET